MHAASDSFVHSFLFQPFSASLSLACLLAGGTLFQSTDSSPSAFIQGRIEAGNGKREEGSIERKTNPQGRVRKFVGALNSNLGGLLGRERGESGRASCCKGEGERAAGMQM